MVFSNIQILLTGIKIFKQEMLYEGAQQNEPPASLLSETFLPLPSLFKTVN
jgi:hypothetical protein